MHLNKSNSAASDFIVIIFSINPIVQIKVCIASYALNEIIWTKHFKAFVTHQLAAFQAF